MEEVRDFSKDFEISFVHVKRSTIGVGDSLSKEFIGHPNLSMMMFGV